MKKILITLSLMAGIIVSTTVLANKQTTTENKIIHLSDSDFASGVSEGITIVDFWATWCYPCKIQGSILDNMVPELEEGVKIAKLDVDKNPVTANMYQVRSIPTMFIFKDGVLIRKMVGVQQKEYLLKEIKALQK